jgi:hypothetical protein
VQFTALWLAAATNATLIPIPARIKKFQSLWLPIDQPKTLDLNVLDLIFGFYDRAFHWPGTRRA